jgi:holo-[acyl-carrier protein] synthase
MIYGIGIDIVKIDRLHASLARFGERFAQRILTADELADYRAQRQPARFLAKRFAAKEAVVKALGLGFRDGLTFNQIGVRHDHYGKPELVYTGQMLIEIERAGIQASLLSLTDEAEYVVAMVVLEGAANRPTGVVREG